MDRRWTDLRATRLPPSLWEPRCASRHQPRSPPTRPRPRRRAPAVTVLKAAKSCFGNIVEVSGIVIAREETQVRPERPGLKVAEVLADAGDTVTAGQTLARLTLPEGGTRRGAGAGGGADLDLDGGDRRAWPRARARRCSPSSRAANSTSSAWCRRGTSPSSQVNQTRADQGHRRRRGRRPGAPASRPTVEPNSQLGQVFIGITTNRSVCWSIRPAGRRSRPGRAAASRCR